MKETEALLELLAMLVASPRTGALLLLLLAAAVCDWRTYRIPNWLTVGGTVWALAVSVIAPNPAHAGPLWSLAGLAIGLFALMPLYVMRVLGAGDVKLMAMVGAFLGFTDTMFTLLYVLVAGGIAAVAFALFHRALGRMAANVRTILTSATYSALGGFKPQLGPAPGASVGRLPYGISIALGTVTYLVAKQLGYA